MKSENFTDEQDIQLIEFVRNNNVLYQTKHRLNSTWPVKENLWLELASTLNKEVIECKTRWRTIRDSYRRRKSKIRKNASRHKSKYNNDNLKFIDDSVADELTHLDEVEIQESQMDVSNINTHFDSSEETQTANEFDGPRKRKENQSKKNKILSSENLHSYNSHFIKNNEIAKIINNEEIETLEGPTTLSNDLSFNKTKIHGSNEHPIEIFFKSMGRTVMQFPPNLIAQTRMKVCEIVSEMELKALEQTKSSRPRKSTFNRK